MIKTDKQLQRFLSSSPIIAYTSKGIARYDITFISDNVKSRLGYEPVKFTADPYFWTDHIHQKDKRRFYKNLERLSNVGHNVLEYRFLHRDGTYRWLRDDARIVRSKSGDSLGIMGYCMDITERKWMEETLGQNVQLYRSLSEIIADFFFRFAIESNGRIAMDWILGRIEEITGYNKRELNHIDKWRDIIFRDDIRRYEIFFQRILSGKANECILRVVAKNGFLKWLQICGKPEWDEQKETINGVTCAVKDVTPRIRMQEKLFEAAKYIAMQQFDGQVAEDVQNLIDAFQDSIYL